MVLWLYDCVSVYINSFNGLAYMWVSLRVTTTHTYNGLETIKYKAVTLVERLKDNWYTVASHAQQGYPALSPRCAITV